MVAQSVKLCEFQKDIIRGIYGTPTRRAVISVGRKNAKTALSAFILCLYMAGPEAKINSAIYSSALSRDQAAIIFDLAAKIIRLSPTLRDYIHIRENAKELYCEGRGTFYKALSADAKTNIGKDPVLLIHDELGQISGPRHFLYEALETSTGTQEDVLSIIISTQAVTDNDLLSIIIDDAKKGEDPETKLFFWTADPEADPFDVETIKQANPAWDHFQNQKEILQMASEARRMPAREAYFRNLILNQRVEAESPFVTSTVWKENGKEPAYWGPLYGGLDLSETNDLTCLVLASPMDGVLHVKPTFWLPEEGLEERSRKDRVPYDVWAKQGHILTTPGRSVEYRNVADYIVGLFDSQQVRKIAFDRWNMKHLRPWLLEAGMSEAMLEERFQDFGQGYASMSPALRVLEGLLLNGKIRHGMHPVLTMCAANAVVKMDEAGNRKLDKKQSRGRIDGMVGLAMAAAMASEDMHRKPIYPVSLESITENISV